MCPLLQEAGWLRSRQASDKQCGNITSWHKTGRGGNQGEVVMPSEFLGGGEGQATSHGVAREDLKGSNFEERGEQCSGQKNWQQQSCLGLAFAGRERR